MEEKRKSKRLTLESEIVLNKLNGDSGTPMKTSINVKDVSKTGMGFTCNEQLNIGNIYECLLTIWTKDTIKAFVEIVRIIKNDDGSYFYGGIFIGMTESDSNRISIYSQFDEAGVYNQ